MRVSVASRKADKIGETSTPPESAKAYLLAAIVESSHDAIISTTAEGILTSWNPAAERLYGYSAAEASGRPITILIPPDRITEELQILTRIGRGESVERLETMRLRKTGPPVTVLVSISPIRDVAGNIVGASQSAHDDSEYSLYRSKLHDQAQLLAAVKDAIIATDEHTKIVSWNPAAEVVYGWQADEVIGRPVSDVLQTEFDDTTREAVHQSILETGEYRGEVRQRRKDGSIIPIESTVRVMRDGQGNTTGMVGVNRDITTRKQAEEASRNQQEILQRIFDHVPVMIRFESGDGRFQLVNECWARTLGWSVEEANRLGDKIFSKFYPDPRECQRVLEFIAAATGEWGEFRTRVRDGQVIDTAFINVRFSDGTAIGIGQDITARKSAEAEIGRHAARAAALAGSAAALNARLDPAAVLKTICAEAARALEVPMAIVQLYDEGREVFEYADSIGLPPGFGQQVRPLPRAAYAAVFSASDTGHPTVLPDMRAVTGLPNAARYAGAGMRTGVAAVLRREGRMLGLLCIATVGVPRKFDSGELALLEGLAGQAALAIANAQLFQEVSAARGRLQALSQRLLEVQEAERRLIARQLHDEIGQALTAVKINLQALQRAVGEPAGGQVDDSIGIVELTLQGVRNLSGELRPALLDDLGLAAALRWFVDRHAQRAGLEARVTAELPEGRLPPEVETASFRVTQEALTNVLRHARARLVEVQLRHDGAALELIVRDDGVGFDVPAAQAQAGRGGSLGLLGMQERVLLLGGEIKIESSPNQGSRVWARFPLAVRAPIERGGTSSQLA